MGLFDDATDRFDPSTTDFTFYQDLEAEEDAELYDEFGEGFEDFNDY